MLVVAALNEGAGLNLALFGSNDGTSSCSNVSTSPIIIYSQRMDFKESVVIIVIQFLPVSRLE